MINEKALMDLFQEELGIHRNVQRALMAVVRKAVADREDEMVAASLHKVRVLAGMPDAGLREKIATIVRVVAAEFGVPSMCVFAKGRQANERAWIRFVAMALLRRLGLSLPEIAEHAGLTNHTSVLWGLRRIDDNPQESARVERLWAQLCERWGVDYQAPGPKAGARGKEAA